MKKVSGTSLKATKGLTMDKVLEEYRDVFQGEDRFEGKVHLEIDETVKPVKQPLRKIPLAMKSRLQDKKTGTVKHNY